jgi:peptide/nickel transport system substrate-binding protein
MVQAYVLDTLVDRDPVTLKWIPRLAQSWKISDDELTIEFTLRRGVTFSDGEPLTAADVVFTVNLIQNEQVEDPRDRVYLDKLAKVEAVGDYGVRLVFKEPYFKSFETAGTLYVMSKKFYSQFTPKELNESTGLLLGSGPYRMADPKAWRPEPGKPIELVRNERYWGEPPGPNRLLWRVIAEPAVRMTAYRNGETDVYYQPSPEQFDTAKNDPALAARTQLFAMDVVTAGYLYIGWNQKKEGKNTYFADPRVRRAMTMLIDREAIIRDIMHGYATVSTGPFSHLSPASDPSVKPWPYDPQAAQKLLAEAGFSRSGNVLTGPDGKEFRFSILYSSTSATAKRIMTFVQDALARAGIVMEPAASEWSVILQQTKERKYDAVFMGWGGVVEEDPQQIFHSDSMKGVGDNFVQYSNPRLDAIIDKARRTMNEDERVKMWHEVHRIIHEDQPYTFMFADWELDMVDKRIKGVEATKLALNSKAEWYVPTAAQRYKQ